MRSNKSSASAQWITTWLDSVADGSNTMSQRSLSSIEKHGGLGAVVVVALERNVHGATYTGGVHRPPTAGLRRALCLKGTVRIAPFDLARRPFYTVFDRMVFGNMFMRSLP